MSGTVYAAERTTNDGISVTFANKDGVRLTRYFKSPYLARKFINKLRFSRKCKVVATSGFLI